MPLLVRDLMHAGVVSCPESSTLGDAAELLVRHRVHALFVESEDGRITGVLADMDLLSGEWLSTDAKSFETMKHITAGELMSTPMVLVDADAPIVDAATKMRREHVARLLVVEDERPVGVLAVSDLVRALATVASDPQTVADVMSRAFVVALPETDLAGLARGMTDRRSRSIVIVDRGGSLQGVVTGHDLLRFVEGGNEGRATAAEIMHAPITIGPGATLSQAADEMLRHEVHRLLVIDDDDRDGVPLGVISTADIVAEMAGPASSWRE